MRANTTRKVDSIKFDSYQSLMAPFAVKDVEVLVNTSAEMFPRLFFAATAFTRALSDELVMVPVRGYICAKTIQSIFDSSYFKAVILDMTGGVDLANLSTRTVLDMVHKELEKEHSKIVCILLGCELTKFPERVRQTLLELSEEGVFVLWGLTTSALFQKMSVILGSPQEFSSIQLIIMGLSRNMAGESTMLAAPLTRKAEFRIYHLALTFKKSLLNLTEKDRLARLAEFEWELLKKEDKALIFWLREWGMTFATFSGGSPNGLQRAVAEKSVDFIKYLQKCGCNFDFDDPINGTCQQIAERAGRMDVATFIEKSRTITKRRPHVAPRTISQLLK
jgi:hypothetical protein